MCWDIDSFSVSGCIVYHHLVDHRGPAELNSMYALFLLSCVVISVRWQPSVFGLPNNIERSVQRAASSLVMTGLRRLGAAAVKGSSFDREM